MLPLVRRMPSPTFRPGNISGSAGAAGCAGSFGRIGLHSNPTPEDREKLFLVDRLRDVVAHPAVEEALAIAEHGVRRHRDDRQRAKVLLRADRLHRLDAVELRHLHVHQHRVEAIASTIASSAAYPLCASVTSSPASVSSSRATSRLISLSSTSSTRLPGAKPHRVARLRHVRVPPLAPARERSEGVVQRRRTDRLVQHGIDARFLGAPRAYSRSYAVTRMTGMRDGSRACA